jgi:hypothetical protein
MAGLLMRAVLSIIPAGGAGLVSLAFRRRPVRGLRPAFQPIPIRVRRLASRPSRRRRSRAMAPASFAKPRSISALKRGCASFQFRIQISSCIVFLLDFDAPQMRLCARSRQQKHCRMS